jgi:predicted GNAT family acetyltransferase
MNIQHNKNGNKGRFYVGDLEMPLAELVYKMTSPETMLIEHTEVSDELRGKNIGYELVEAAVAYARENKIKIIPLCPFAAAVFKKRATEYKDVLENS